MMAWELLLRGGAGMRYLTLFVLLVLRTTEASAEAFEESRAYAVEGVIVEGDHWRLDTVHGAVHVWAPQGYVPETATLVVYIHGYYVDVDDAWWAHGLPEQFGASGINALFVAPESPSGNSDDVRWDSITDLALTIEDMIPVAMPRGRRVVVAHSGGFRTVLRWLGDPNLDTVALLDAGYGFKSPYVEWFRKAASHRFLAVSSETVWWCMDLSRWIPIHEIDGLAKLGPRTLQTLAHERAVHVRTNLDHWGVVTTAIVPTLQMLGAVRLPPP